MNNIRLMEELNYEVKLIEEQQDIDIQAIEYIDTDNPYIETTDKKINELIQAVKQLDRNINKE